MGQLRDSILAAAQAEWTHWGKSTWDLIARKTTISHTDDEIPYARYVIEKYCSVGGGNPSVDDISDDRYYWSAVGMSAIMKRAGLDKARFPFAQAHSVWARRFIANRKAGDANAIYWGYRIGEAGGQPLPGDLMVYSRAKGASFTQAAKLFDATGSYSSHSDVVVASRPGSIDVIGCNVKDSVTLKRLPIDADGHVSDRTHAWFAVLKLRN